MLSRVETCALLALVVAWSPPFSRGQCVCAELAHLISSDVDSQGFFGTSISSSGDTIVIGSYGVDAPGAYHAGAAYVYVRESPGHWTQQAKLLASDGTANDYFGLAVAISGDTIVVGAPYNGVTGIPECGSAYVFVRAAGVWSEQAKLTAADAAANDLFGRSVAIDHDIAIVGAPQAGTNELQRGAAYAFVRDALGNWVQEARLDAPDCHAGAWLGQSVAVRGHLAVLGAPDDTTPAGIHSGTAHVFRRGDNGTWEREARLVAQDGQVHDVFGWAVAAVDNTVMVGARQFNGGITTEHGAVYSFVPDGVGGWRFSAKLQASDGAGGDAFGTSVVVEGNAVAIGARYADVESKTDAGAVYIFHRGGRDRWLESAKLTAADGSLRDSFGASVALADGVLLVGAPWDDRPGASDAGSTYVYDVRCAVCTPCDANCDGSLNLFDITAFVSLLTPPAPPSCSPCAGDTSGDGTVNAFDISAFVGCLEG